MWSISCFGLITSGKITLDEAQRPSGHFGEHKNIFPCRESNRKSSQSLYRPRNPGFSLHTEIMRKTKGRTFVALSMTVDQHYSLRFSYSYLTVLEQGTESVAFERRDKSCTFLIHCEFNKVQRGSFRKSANFN